MKPSPRKRSQLPVKVPTKVPTDRPKRTTDLPTNRQYLSGLHNPARSRPKQRTKKHEALRTYQRDILGLDHNDEAQQDEGEFPSSDDASHRGNEVLSCRSASSSEDSELEPGEIIEPVEPELGKIVESESLVTDTPDAVSFARDLGLPTVTELYNGGFGKPSLKLNFFQQGAFETILFFFFRHLQSDASMYLTGDELASLLATHPLIKHLWKMIRVYPSKLSGGMVNLGQKQLDITQLRVPDPNYATQTAIPMERERLFNASLFYYGLDIGNVVRFAGDEYTGMYRDIVGAVARMRELGIDDDLLADYTRLMTVGAPSHFVAETTRENAMLHWRSGNHPSITENLEKIEKAMNKLEQHRFSIPFSSWIARFIPHIFFTPHHLLKKPGKKDRLIFDASRRYTPSSIPINMMTSTKQGAERDCEYGQTLERVLTRVWNLRISYPAEDIILHASDVKSCFRQLKHHPDVVAAFAHIIGR